MTKDHGGQNPGESYTKDLISRAYFLQSWLQISVDDKFSKSFKSHLGKDAFYNFINSLIEKSKDSSDVIKKHFNKKLVMTK